MIELLLEKIRDHLFENVNVDDTEFNAPFELQRVAQRARALSKLMMLYQPVMTTTAAAVVRFFTCSHTRSLAPSNLQRLIAMRSQRAKDRALAYNTMAEVLVV